MTARAPTGSPQILVGELQAGDGFFTPEQGAQIVVKCILGKFYGDNPVNSNVKVNEKVTIDGHEGWLVESQLTFDIEGLETKGELLIVAIVSAGNRSGLYYASIPDTTPELVQPARDCAGAASGRRLASLIGDALSTAPGRGALSWRRRVLRCSSPAFRKPNCQRPRA